MEEKIIDEVDVAGCEHYDDICYEEDIFPLSCKGNDCMYKQLKRLEQEQSHNKLYDDLLEVVKPYLSDFTGYDEKEQCFNIVLAVKEILGQLEQENEELKQATDGLLKIQYALADSCNKKETALEEIREIATALKQTKIPYCQIEEQIQEIITEAIGDKE